MPKYVPVVIIIQQLFININIWWIKIIFSLNGDNFLIYINERVIKTLNYYEYDTFLNKQSIQFQGNQHNLGDFLMCDQILQQIIHKDPEFIGRTYGIASIIIN